MKAFKNKLVESRGSGSFPESLHDGTGEKKRVLRTLVDNPNHTTNLFAPIDSNTSPQLQAEELDKRARAFLKPHYGDDPSEEILKQMVTAIVSYTYVGCPSSAQKKALDALKACTKDRPALGVLLDKLAKPKHLALEMKNEGPYGIQEGKSLSDRRDKESLQVIDPSLQVIKTAAANGAFSQNTVVYSRKPQGLSSKHKILQHEDIQEGLEGAKALVSGILKKKNLSIDGAEIFHANWTDEKWKLSANEKKMMALVKLATSVAGEEATIGIFFGDFTDATIELLGNLVAAKTMPGIVNEIWLISQKFLLEFQGPFMDISREPEKFAELLILYATEWVEVALRVITDRTQPWQKLWPRVNDLIEMVLPESGLARHHSQNETSPKTDGLGISVASSAWSKFSSHLKAQIRKRIRAKTRMPEKHQSIVAQATIDGAKIVDSIVKLDIAESPFHLLGFTVLSFALIWMILRRDDLDESMRRRLRSLARERISRYVPFLSETEAFQKK